MVRFGDQSLEIGNGDQLRPDSNHHQSGQYGRYHRKMRTIRGK